MRTTLTRALVGLGLAGALFLGAGAAVAQTTGDESSSTATTAQDAQQNGNGTAPAPPTVPSATTATTAATTTPSSEVMPAGRRRGPGIPRRGRAATPARPARRLRASRGA